MRTSLWMLVVFGVVAGCDGSPADPATLDDYPAVLDAMLDEMGRLASSLEGAGSVSQAEAAEPEVKASVARLEALIARRGEVEALPRAEVEAMFEARRSELEALSDRLKAASEGMSDDARRAMDRSVLFDLSFTLSDAMNFESAEQRAAAARQQAETDRFFADAEGSAERSRRALEEQARRAGGTGSGPGAGPGAAVLEADPLLQRLVGPWRAKQREHGEAGVVAVVVRGMPADMERGFVRRRLLALTGLENTPAVRDGSTSAFVLAPVSDLRALAEAIDFGAVTVDEAARVLTVEMGE